MGYHLQNGKKKAPLDATLKHKGRPQPAPWSCREPLVEVVDYLVKQRFDSRLSDGNRRPFAGLQAFVNKQLELFARFIFQRGVLPGYDDPCFFLRHVANHLSYSGGQQIATPA